MSKAELKTWYLEMNSIAGYFEPDFGVPGEVEIAYFGLAPDFISKGLGGLLLSCAIKFVWAVNGVKRVWVHTCTQDHPSALENYKARGLKVYRVESKERDEHGKI